MSTQVAIYIYAFLGMTAFMGLFAGLICHRHRKMVNQHRAYERMAQERMQQVQEENLPPFYIDHVRDRACVFEGELPPDNFPRALEVVVVRPRRQESMEDLFAATSGGAPGATGTAGTGTDAGTAAVTEGPRRNNTSMDPPDLIGSAVPHLGISVVESGTIRPVPTNEGNDILIGV
ncbi:hypothetical protein BGX33_010017 [Mortierella sp. NVP41]|nr:hypothetical protein BGX33_010017 [Mortierella sp. NVP41]